MSGVGVVVTTLLTSGSPRRVEETEVSVDRPFPRPVNEGDEMSVFSVLVSSPTPDVGTSSLSTHLAPQK